MAAYFEDRADDDTAAKFRPSSMETIRSFGGDPLTLVSEVPLFVLPGVGAFAEQRARRVLDGLDIAVGRMLHPSPASPRANRGWAAEAERDGGQEREREARRQEPVCPKRKEDDEVHRRNATAL